MEKSVVRTFISRESNSSNSYAVSASELGTGLSNAGSALFATGNTLEESIGLITAANASVNKIAA